MYYKVIGDGKPVIFLHGWGLNHESFLGFSKSLYLFKCFYVDLYGFGYSEMEKELTLLDYVDGVSKIIEENRLDDVTIVGHSFGGRVALKLANLNNKVKHIVLIDSAGLKPKLKLVHIMRKIKYKICKILHLSTINCGSPDYIALSSIKKKTFVNIVNYYLDSELKSIKQDCLIMWGKKDKETPLYMAHKLNREIKNSALVEFEGGHFAYAENPSHFISILLAYLNGVYDTHN